MYNVSCQPCFVWKNKLVSSCCYFGCLLDYCFALYLLSRRHERDDRPMRAPAGRPRMSDNSRDFSVGNNRHGTILYDASILYNRLAMCNYLSELTSTEGVILLFFANIISLQTSDTNNVYVTFICYTNLYVHNVIYSSP